MCLEVLFDYMSVYHIYAVPKEVRGGDQTPLNQVLKTVMSHHVSAED